MQNIIFIHLIPYQAVDIVWRQSWEETFSIHHKVSFIITFLAQRKTKPSIYVKEKKNENLFLSFRFSVH